MDSAIVGIMVCRPEHGSRSPHELLCKCGHIAHLHPSYGPCTGQVTVSIDGQPIDQKCSCLKFRREPLYKGF